MECIEKKPGVTILEKLSADTEYCHTYVVTRAPLGKKMILKYENPNTRYSRERLKMQKRVLLQLHELDDSINTCRFVSCGIWDKRFWVLLTYVGGQPINQLRSVGKKMKERLDKILSKIHSLPVQGFGFLRGGPRTGIKGLFDKWEDFLVDRFDHNFPSLSQFISNTEEKRIKSYFYKGLEMIETKEKGVLVHGDVKSQNLIYNTNTKRLYLIDWETAFSGDPLIEQAIMMYKADYSKLSPVLVDGGLHADRLVRFYKNWQTINEIGWEIRHGHLKKASHIQARIKRILNSI